MEPYARSGSHALKLYDRRLERLKKLENGAEIARYSCQMWTRHFGNADWFQALEDAACAEFSGRVFDIAEFWPDSHLGKVRCEFRPLTDDEAAWNGRGFAQKTYVALDFLLMNVREDALRASLEKDNRHRSDDLDIDTLLKYAIAYQLEMFCEALIFLANVAFCGVMGVSLKQVSVSGEFLLQGEAIQAGLPRSREEYDFLSGPIVQRITLDEILAWSRRCGGIWSGGAVTSIEKAISFLSHSFSGKTRDNVSILLWGTAGLEAIACDGDNSIVSQLKRRLPLVCDLIPFSNIVKTINKSYNFRSRLFHGNIPTINSFMPNDVDWNEGRYDSELERQGLVVQLLLISAVWESIKSDSNSLEFIETVHFSRIP